MTTLTLDELAEATHDSVRAGNLDQAIAGYEAQLDPAREYLAGVLHNLCQLYLTRRNVVLAKRAAEAAVFFAPSTQAWLDLGACYCRLCDQDRAFECSQQALALEPDNPICQLSCVYELQTQGDPSAGAAAAREAFGKEVPSRNFLNSRVTSRRLRVGYVSGDFRGHVMSRIIEPLLTYHEESAVDTYCFDNGAVEDKVTERLRGLADHWITIRDLPAGDARDRIQALGIDILVDLSGLTFGNRLDIFQLRAAPIQLTWAGHLATTGAGCFDGRLTDEGIDPPGVEHLYSEPLIRLPASYAVDFSDHPELSEPPSRSRGYCTFGMICAFTKVTQRMIDLWVRILLAAPESKLVLVLLGAHDEDTAQTVLRRFGPASPQVLLTERVTPEGFFRLFSEIDVVLDTHPYGSGMTALHALWMGVPVVALAGDRGFSRTAGAVLREVGLQAQTSEENYVTVASWYADGSIALPNRARIRSRCAVSPRFQPEPWVREVEGVYRNLWKGWCGT